MNSTLTLKQRTAEVRRLRQLRADLADALYTLPQGSPERYETEQKLFDITYRLRCLR